MQPLTLKPLPYAYSDLAPYFDAETMQLHHDKHHQTYTDKLNAALAVHTELPESSVENLLKNLDAVPADIRMAVKNHGGGYYNHSLFWDMLSKNTAITGAVASALTESFGSVEKFKEMFTNQALGLFGSGWIWLVKTQSGKLEILTTANQDNPISSHNVTILLTLDLWEHSYYLKYQNRRIEYVNNWWQIVNWNYVDEALAGK